MSRSPQRRRGPLGTRRFRLEPLEERTLLSFSATMDQGVAQLDPTNVPLIEFAVVFDAGIDPASFTVDDVTLGGTATAAVTGIINTNPGVDTEFTVQVTAASDGTVTADIEANKVQNAAKNDLNAASANTDNEVTYDSVAPTANVELGTGQSASTTTPVVTFEVTFSEPVVDFDLTTVGAANLAGSSAPGAAVTAITPAGPASQYTVTVGGLTGDGTVAFSCPAGMFHDAASNGNADSTSTGGNIVLYDLPMTVQVEQADGVADPLHTQADPTNNPVVHFTAIFNEPVDPATFTAADVILTTSVAGTAVTALAPIAGTDNWDIEVTMGGDGAVTAQLDAGAVKDLAGHLSPASTSADSSVVYDSTAPDVTIDQAAGQSDPSITAPVHFTVVFSEPIDPATFDVADVNVTAGTVTAINAVGTDNTTFDVEVDGGLAVDAVITADIPAGVVADLAGNLNAVSTSADDTVIFNVPLTVQVDKKPGQSDSTNVSTIWFEAQFSEAINAASFTEFDITIGGTSAGATVNAGSLALIGLNLYEFSVEAVADGTVTAAIAAGKVFSDGPVTGESNAASTSTDNEVLYDTVEPGVTINQFPTQADPTSAAVPVRFVAVFDEDIDPATVDGGDLTLTLGDPADTLAWTTVTPIQLDARTWYFDVSGFGGDQHGTLVASMAAGAVADPAGNTNAASTSTDAQVTVDTTTLTVDIALAAGQLAMTSDTVINFTVTFSIVPSVAFDSSMVDAWNYSTAFDWNYSPCVVVTDSGDHMTYNVAVSGMDWDGNVEIAIAPNQVYDDYGNPNQGAGGWWTAAPVVQYDRLFEVVLEQNAGQADPTAFAPIAFIARFSEQPVDFGFGKVSLAGSTAPGASVLSVTNLGYWSYSEDIPGVYEYLITVDGMTGDGTVVAAVNGLVHNAIWQVANVLPAADNQVVYTLAPTVTVEQKVGQADPAAGAAINFTVVFSEPVTGFTAADVDVDNTLGSAFYLDLPGFGWNGGEDVIVTPAVVVTDSGDHQTYNVAVSGMIADGHVIVTVPAGVAVNGSGVASVASTGTDNVVMYDAPLTVTIDQAAGQADPTGAAEVHFTAVFSEPVKNFSTASVTLATAPGAAVTAINNPSGDKMTYDVVVNGMTGSGSITATIAAGMVCDWDGEVNVASTSADNEVTYDVDAPTATITPPAGPVTGDTVDFAVQFSETVTGFTAADVTLGGTAAGTLAATVEEVDGSGGTDYIVSVTGMTGDGTVTLTIVADAAVDEAGNGNPLSGPAAADYDYQPPVPPDPISLIVVAEAGGVENGILESDEDGVITWAFSTAGNVTAKSVLIDGVATPVKYLYGPFGPFGDNYYFAAVFNPLAAGDHTYQITTTDDLGVTDTADGTFTVTAAAVAGPAISLVTVSDKPRQDGALQAGENGIITWAVTAGNPIADTTLTIAGVPVTLCYGPYGPYDGGAYYYGGAFGPVAAGNYNYTITATDDQGADATFNGTFTVAAALMVDASIAPSGTPSVLTDAELSPIIVEAQQRLVELFGSRVATILEGVTFQIVDLPEGMLGEAAGDVVRVDQDAAGYGWFVDATPGDDLEFVDFKAVDSAAVNRADLLTVVMHELGHVIGFDHAEEGLMDDLLPLGTRRTDAADAVFAGYGG